VTSAAELSRYLVSATIKASRRGRAGYRRLEQSGRFVDACPAPARLPQVAPTPTLKRGEKEKVSTRACICAAGRWAECSSLESRRSWPDAPRPIAGSFQLKRRNNCCFKSPQKPLRETKTFSTEAEAKQFAKEMLLSGRKNISAGTLLSADQPARRIISGSQLHRWIEEEA